MTRDEVATVIEDERLAGAVWFREPVNDVNSLAIYEKDGAWHVVATDERAVRRGEAVFDTENSALERFIQRLRSLNRLKSSGYIG